MNMEAAAGRFEQLADENNQWREHVFGLNPRRTLRHVLGWFILTLVVFHHLFLPVKIVGSSMSPTYHDGAMNLVNRWSYTRQLPQRGDVVVLDIEGEILLKRIVAVPGEKVALSNGVICIDDHPKADPFADIRIPWEMDPVTLRPGEFFVIGDNRETSVFAKVNRSQIIGKLMF